MAARRRAGSRKAAAPSPWRQRLPRLAAWLLPLLVLGGLGWGGLRYLEEPGRMPVRVIEVDGEFTWLDPAEIERRVARHVAGGFFGLDLAALRADVLALPWVDEVSVRRVWPDKVRLQVVEQVPLAYWNRDALLNLKGEVFRPAKLPHLEQLPHLAGEDAHAREVAAFYLRLQSGVLPPDLRVTALTLDRRGAWRLRFANGLHLALGEDGPLLERRLAAFARVWPQLSADKGRRPRRIDMRYEHGFAVQWQTPPEAQAAVQSARTGDI